MSPPQDRPPGATVPAGQPENPEVRLLEGPGGQVTLYIAGGQAVQGWERTLLCESADILCTYGSRFLEVGLGLGLSALRIAQHPNTRRHLVIEKYQAVIDLFRKLHPFTPSALEIVHADFFEFISHLDPASFDGVFFDPTLPRRFGTTKDCGKRSCHASFRFCAREGSSFRSFLRHPSCASSSSAPLIESSWNAVLLRHTLGRFTRTDPRGTLTSSAS